MSSKLLTVATITLLSSTVCFAQKSAHDDKSDAPKIYEGLQSNVRLAGKPSKLSTLKERMEHHKVPGVSIAFLQDNKILWTHTEGVTDTVSNKAIDKNTVFQAASISKPVFATVLMKYRQEHGLDLDADVNNLLTSWQLPTHQWAASSPVTLRRLLSHSAGTTVHGFGGYASGEKVPSILAVLNGVEPANSASVIVDIEPGTQFRYSGGGTTLAQLVLQDISGVSLPQLAQSTVFGPLGMKHSRYAQPLDGDLARNAAVPFMSNGEPVEGGAHTYATMAAAGLWTTPSDLMKFASKLQQSASGADQTFLDQSTATEMLTPQMKPVGIGFFLGGGEAVTTFGHGGSNAGFKANLFAHINTGDGIAVMTNGDNGGALIKEIKNRAAEIYGWPELFPTIKTEAPFSKDLQNSFVGTYEIKQPIQAMLKIIANGEALIVNLPEYIDNVPFYIESAEKIFSLNDINMNVVHSTDGEVEKLEFWDGEATRVSADTTDRE